MKHESIPLSQLKLDRENPRHQELANDIAIINWMLENAKPKLLPLLKNIAEDGFDPTSILAVIASGDDGYVVIEGNRRTAALKLLSHSELAENKIYQRRISQIINKYKPLRLPRKIRCVIAPSRKACEKILERRHHEENGGIGIIPWGAIERERYNQRSGKNGRHADALRALDKAIASEVIDEEDIESQAFPITTLSRVMRSKPFQEFSGIRNIDGRLMYTIKQEEANKPLFKVIKDLANKDIKVDHVKTRKKIGDYLKKLDQVHVPISSKPLKTPEPFGSTVSKPRSRKQRTFTERTMLVPSSFKPNIDNEKTKGILTELKGLHLNRFSNAIAVLFRVFIDMTVAAAMPDADERNTRANIVNLTEKLRREGLLSGNEARPILEAAKDKDHSLHIQSFHAYIHNPKYQPTTDDLRKKWDNFEPFLKASWEYANKQSS